MRLVSEMLANHQEFEVNDQFLKNLSVNLTGKRAVVQKRAR